MKKPAAILLLSVAACFHTHSVQKGDEEAQDTGEARQPARHEGSAAQKPSQARRPEKPGRPPLAASPSGLFVPGAVEQIQKALASKGYLDLSEVKSGDIDATTSAAVRKFQGDQGLARTGNPDHETVRLLGLDAEKLFRKSSTVKDKP